MRFEFRKGSLHASHVRSAFLAAIPDFLASSAFAELDAADLSDLDTWATRHGINAPCVIEHFSSFCNGGWSKYGSYETASWNGPEIPLEWLQSVGSWNSRLIDRWAWLGINADDDLLQWMWNPAWNASMNVGTELEGPRWAPESVSEAVRERALDRNLGPIATDPMRESWDDFLKRARLHWIARALMAKRAGFTPASQESEFRNLTRDIQWVLRHQIKGESYAEIAGPQDVDEAIDPDRVKKAVDKLCRVIGLRRLRGRPSLRKTEK